MSTGVPHHVTKEFRPSTPPNQVAERCEYLAFLRTAGTPALTEGRRFFAPTTLLSIADSDAIAESPGQQAQRAFHPFAVGR
ncbi:hypothetical protein [Rhizobium binae]|uniref:hypothetical protein n=1 Tax=Rhizobium binae TaxID=1138190 RepID=UPI001C8295CD|nr:hypothetical protein [Rhizobium binae]MBX4944804.1 hypothetical protein [Rhizobium binae]